MLNTVVLVGRLTRDPESRTTTGGKSVCDFSLAVQKRVKPSDGSADADFFRVVCWERTADFVAEYLGKGRLVGVEGRLQSRKYVASDGTNREIVEVVATSVQSLEKPKDNEDTAEYVARPAATTTRATTAGIDEYDPFADE